MRTTILIVFAALLLSSCSSSEVDSTDAGDQSEDPKTAQIQEGARELGEQVCGSVGWEKIADEYGGTDEVSAAEAYAGSMNPAAYQAALDGCLSGFGYGD
ncbi:MAG: hypothetical protein ACPHCI_08680 [Solirubrobacterales bacterium]